MYIAWKFGPTYWKTACLNVDAGLIGDDFSGMKYGSVASAIANLDEPVTVPDVQTSGLVFTPKEGQILFGLAAVSGINQQDAQSIIDNRPYVDLKDFIVKTELTKSKLIAIAKSGALNNLTNNKNTFDTMKQVVLELVPKRGKLTTVQLPKIMNSIPEKFQYLAKAYNFKKYAKSHADKNVDNAWIQTYEEMTKASYDYDKDGHVVVNFKEFDKWFNKESKELKEWLKSEDAIQAMYRFELNDFWNTNIEGNTESWSFQALSFYPDKHEILSTPIQNYYELDSFKSLPVDGELTPSGRMSFKDVFIAGTVVDKNEKGLITIVSTTGEVVIVRINKRLYQHYNNKIMQGKGKDRKCIDDSWFIRGTKLLVKGHRQGNEFKTVYKQPINKIVGYADRATMMIDKKVE